RCNKTPRHQSTYIYQGWSCNWCTGKLDQRVAVDRLRPPYSWSSVALREPVGPRFRHPLCSRLRGLIPCLCKYLRFAPLTRDGQHEPVHDIVRLSRRWYYLPSKDLHSAEPVRETNESPSRGQ